MLFFLLLAMLPPSAGAQQQTSISVSRSVIDIGGAPGDILESPLTITNNSQSFIPMSIVVRPKIQNSGLFLRTDLSAETLTTIDEPQFIINPNESKTIAVNVQLPDDIGPGGYYADIVTRALVLDDPTRLTTALPELATSLFVTVTGEAEESHIITQEQRNVLFLNSGQEQQLRFTIENTGNVHSLFMPTLVIGDKQVVQEKSPVLLLPGEETQLEYLVSSDALDVGAYTTELQYSFGTPTQFIAEPSSRIIVTPFSPLLGALAGVSIVAVLLFRARKRVFLAYKALVSGSVPS